MRYNNLDFKLDYLPVLHTTFHRKIFNTPKKIFLHLTGILILIASCTAPYDFNVENKVDNLVVDGLITDQPEVYKIKLHMASGYGNISNMPLLKANVSISDDAGNLYLFIEDKNGPGVYKSVPSEFTAKPGYNYTLHIHTPAGDEFQSSPQLLLPGQRIDSVYGEKSFEYSLSADADGNYISHKTEGVAVYIDIRNRNSDSQYFRLMNTIYLQYIYQYNVMFSPIVYGWTKYTASVPGDGMCITNNSDGISTNEIKKLKFTFIPFDRSFYNIIDIARMQKFSIIINQFRMNAESSEYYKEVVKQLTAEGKLFDPISTQLNGNIFCVNDSKKQAFGFFEASSKISYVYSDESLNYILNPVFKLQPFNLDTIPDNGTSPDHHPPFWIN